MWKNYYEERKASRDTERLASWKGATWKRGIELEDTEAYQPPGIFREEPERIKNGKRKSSKGKRPPVNLEREDPMVGVSFEGDDDEYLEDWECVRSKDPRPPHYSSYDPQASDTHCVAYEQNRQSDLQHRIP